MKKTFILTIVCFLSTVAILEAQKNRPMDIVLENIEALAAGESIYDYRYPKTVACDDYQEGWGHTASVERICVFSVAPSTCTPKACGEEF